jgi:hypothetical protein
MFLIQLASCFSSIEQYTGKKIRIGKVTLLKKNPYPTTIYILFMCEVIWLAARQ